MKQKQIKQVYLQDEQDPNKTIEKMLHTGKSCSQAFYSLSKIYKTTSGSRTY